jgi:hypothetical protein
VLGERVSLVAMPFAVLSVGGSTSDVGAVATAVLAPMSLLSPVGGVRTD